MATAQQQGVQFVGLEDAQAALKRWAKTMLPGDFAKGTRPFADSMAGLIRNQVPVVTGALQSSVEPWPEPTNNGVGMGGADTPYASWIEFGGSRSRDLVPQGRYVYPTVASHLSQLGNTASEATVLSIVRYPWPQAA